MIEYRSVDRKFAVRLQEEHLQQIAVLCNRAQTTETGGILIGQYTDNLSCAAVSDLLGPASDSKSGRTWFERGTKGVNKLIGDYWNKKNSYYLGEWHYHPFAAPSPSGQDLAQMRKIALTLSYKCPEPVLIIAGGNPFLKLQLRVFVFPRGELVELFYQEHKESPV